MSVRRDKKTGRWYFRVRVRHPDGTPDQIYGTPGIPGRFHDLPQTKIGAMEAERRAIAAVVNGKWAGTAASVTKEAPKTKSIREHGDAFLDLYKPEQKPSAKRDKRASLKSLLPYFGDLMPDQLKQGDVDTFVAAELKRGAARKSINNRLASLSTLLKYATGERSKLRLHVSGTDSEIRAVDPADVERLLDACSDDRYRAALLLAYEAGLRVGEIRGLQWTDLKEGKLTVRRALDKETNEALTPKHGRVRTVPLSPRLAAALDALHRRGIWVVSRDDGGALGYWPMLEAAHAIYGRAGVAVPRSTAGRAMPFHCVRHSHGTVMARKVPLPVLRDLMGHSEIETTMRYVDVSEADKRDAIEAVFGDGRAVAVQCEVESAEKE